MTRLVSQLPAHGGSGRRAKTATNPMLAAPASAIMRCFISLHAPLVRRFVRLGASGSPVAFRGESSDAYGQINYGVLVAGAVIAMIPCVIIYVALQRYYVRGLVSGAVKG